MKGIYYVIIEPGGIVLASTVLYPTESIAKGHAARVAKSEWINLEGKGYSIMEIKLMPTCLITKRI